MIETNELDEAIKALDVYSNFGEGVYRGINQNYFGKWEGWTKLTNSASQEEIEELVIEFYKTFFYYQLRLDLIEDSSLSWAILNFATKHGKRKAISKLQKVLGLSITGKGSAGLMSAVDTLSKTVKPKLFLEFIEFYFFIGYPTEARWVFKLAR